MVGVYDLLAATAAACLGVAALWIVRGRGRADRGGPREDFVRYAGLAALAALVCAVMNILEVAQGGLVAAAVGNATNVFAPAILWAGARRLNGRRGIGAAAAGAAALLMLAVTFVVALDDATLLKTSAIAVFCVLAAIELRRGPLRSTAGSATMAGALALFALYNVARLVIAFGTGTDSWVWNSFASAQATSIASVVVLLVIAAASVPMGRALADDPAPGTRAHDRAALRSRALEMLSTQGELTVLTIRAPELDLIRAAHGAERADDVVSTIVAATRQAVPDASVGRVSRDTVVALLPPETERAGIDRAVARAFAALSPRDGEGAVPELRVLHRGVADRAGVDAVLRDAVGRHRSPFARRAV